MDKLQGFAPPCHPTYVKSSDMSELSEQDVWETVSFPPVNQRAGNSTPLSDWAGSISGKNSWEEAHWVRYNSRSRTAIGRGSVGSLGNGSLRKASGTTPMRIPDWAECRRVMAARNEEDEDEDEDGLKVKLPPHEIVARDHARTTQMTSFSLKGRDLNNVRDAVWRYTGFLRENSASHK